MMSHMTPATTRIQQSVALKKFSWRFCKIEPPQSSSGTEFFWAYLPVFPLQKLHSIALKWRRMTCLLILLVASILLLKICRAFCDKLL